MMKARSLTAAGDGNGALYQSRTYTVTTKIHMLQGLLFPHGEFEL